MIRRFFYAVFLTLGGIVFAVPKWILFGTRASRQRQKLIRLQKKQLRQAKRARRTR